jgi:hypothetical protein
MYTQKLFIAMRNMNYIVCQDIAHWLKCLKNGVKTAPIHYCSSVWTETEILT